MVIKFAIDALLENKLKSKDINTVGIVVPRLAPNTIGIAREDGRIPDCANTTIRPVVTELDCTMAVSPTETTNASHGLEIREKW